MTTARHEPAEPAEPPPVRSIASGLAWNTMFQIFNTAVSFGAMLFMVRLLSPAEYGRAAAALAIISMATVIGSPSFVAHSLQLGEDETPDWTLHWNVSLPLQFALFILLNAIAALCWTLPTYRPVAGLLHVGALGILLEWPAQIAGFTLRRNLDFRRLRILQGASGIFNAVVMIVIAYAGGGAYALIIANNVLPAVALTADLLLFRRWKPEGGWWRAPDLTAYADAVRFGAQTIGSGLLARSRAFAEGMFLPLAAGYPAIGMMNRASALHGLTVLRIESVIMETVYPMLPRAASDEDRFRRMSTIYAQVVILTSACGSIAVGLLGTSLSRVLYGQRWAAADPYIWPAALLGLGITISSVAVNVLLAQNRLRAVLLLNTMGAALGLPVIIVALVAESLQPYMWFLVASQAVTACAAVITASRYFQSGWQVQIFGPAIVLPAVASIAVLGVTPLIVGMPLAPSVALRALLFILASVVVTRAFFPVVGARILDRLPGSARSLAFFKLQRWSGR